MAEETPFVWRGVEVQKLGQLVDAIAALSSQEEAQEFITAYRAAEPYADENAGYVTGYLDPTDAARLRGWMRTPHPVFGMGSPTPEQALEAGKRFAHGEFS